MARPRRDSRILVTAARSRIWASRIFIGISGRRLEASRGPWTAGPRVWGERAASEAPGTGAAGTYNALDELLRPRRRRRARRIGMRLAARRARGERRPA